MTTPSEERKMTDAEVLAVAALAIFGALDCLVTNQTQRMNGTGVVPHPGWACRLERELEFRGITRG